VLLRGLFVQNISFWCMFNSYLTICAGLVPRPSFLKGSRVCRCSWLGHEPVHISVLKGLHATLCHHRDEKAPGTCQPACRPHSTEILDTLHNRYRTLTTDSTTDTGLTTLMHYRYCHTTTDTVRHRYTGLTTDLQMLDSLQIWTH
jgi:hypothetical protein